jgi:superfamily II DNA/RNA helicase
VNYPALEAISVTADSADGLEFGDLGLGERIVDAIKELGASRPFALQAATIPVALSGRHVLGRGRTGSGKTIAFAAPVVERLLRLSSKGVKRAISRAPRALILAPHQGARSSALSHRSADCSKRWTVHHSNLWWCANRSPNWCS